jgi:hypothetical protein
MILPFDSPATLFHIGFEVGDRGLHRLGALEHKRKLHLPGAEEFTDDLHAIQQEGVDDFQRPVGGQRLGEVVFQADAIAVDDAQLETVLDRLGLFP